ncbi:hypothetical protein WJX79_007932 [Trebouxia sp. C0005]
MRQKTTCQAQVSSAEDWDAVSTSRSRCMPTSNRLEGQGGWGGKKVGGGLENGLSGIPLAEAVPCSVSTSRLSCHVQRWADAYPRCWTSKLACCWTSSFWADFM